MTSVLHSNAFNTLKVNTHNNNKIALLWKNFPLMGTLAFGIRSRADVEQDALIN